MQFRTTFHLEKAKNTIDYSSNIVLMGSCFSNSIATKLTYHKFNILNNPYGILFSPTAIEQSFTEICNQKVYTAADLITHNGLYHSMQHHSSFSDINSSVVLEKINRNITTAKAFLEKASHITITLGTAWVYHYIEQDKLVANCHKIPQQNFVKRLLSVAEIKASLKNSIALLKQLNPNCTIIFTLSPVRHIKDGFVANANNKARLLTAIHEVIDEQSTYYFPSYEIMLDDLRDYRFYKADMLHPNAVAINYIWEKFKTIWISEEAMRLSERVASLQRDLAHKPFNEKSKAHQQFLASITQKKEALKNLGINF